MRWIGLHLPDLSLESFAATLPPGQAQQPLALVDAHRIVSVNRPAHLLGVQPGIKRATALSLAPALVLGQADGLRDAQALAGVAHAALAFTPAVSLAPPSGVLLEVGSTLRCFGGQPRLLQSLKAALAPLGHRWHRACAPTAQGAHLLSLVHEDVDCPDRAFLARTLKGLPIELLKAGQAHQDTLHGMGLRTFGDVHRLPRAGLAQRFGQALLDEMDAALGRVPDPREPVALPLRFEGKLELFARADTTEQVLHGAQVLLEQLVAWLSGQHACVRHFSLHMKHEPRWRRDAGLPGATVLEVALAEPSRDAAHLMVLLRERLGRLQLPAPTLELSLQASDLSMQPPPFGELFPTPRSGQAGIARLIERLQARLGRDQVQRLSQAADHRPEYATAVRPAEAQALCSSQAPGCAEIPVPSPILRRPVWLMPQAQPLQECHASPLLEGRALRLLAGPERVEAGWWDGALAERDYFIAQTEDGALVWLYRERLPLPGKPADAGWFLHGRFG